jgi:hypothetical protein
VYTGIPPCFQHPRDRAEVDDRAAAGLLHVGDHGLCGEELMLEVHRDPASHDSGVVASMLWRVSFAALLTRP